MSRAKKQYGFTLFELLVVVVVMGVATTIGGQIFTRVLDTWRTVSLRAELDEMAGNVFKRMGTDFADLLAADLTGTSLVGMTQSASDLARYPEDSLANDTLIMRVRTALGAQQSAAGATIKYRVEHEAERDLLVQTAGDLATDIPIGGRIEMIPEADVIGLRIEYLGHDGHWLDSSQSDGWFESELPRAVRVSLALQHRDNPAIQIARNKVFPIHVD